jgi:hypothetical protein
VRAAATALLLATARLAFAQAEPAPEGYVPPHRRGAPPVEPGPRETPSGLPKWHISVAPHLNVLLSDGPAGLPTLGYGGGVQVTRALLPLGRGRFGVGFDFAYDRFSHALASGGTQLDAHALFALMAIVDGIAGRVRPWLGVGGGLSVVNYENPTPTAVNPGGISLVGAVGLIKLALGLGVRVYEQLEVGLRADFDLTFSSQKAGTPPRDVFAPGLFSLGLDFGFRF